MFIQPRKKFREDLNFRFWENAFFCDFLNENEIFWQLPKKKKQILGKLMKAVNNFTWNYWQTQSSNVKVFDMIISLSLWSKLLKIWKKTHFHENGHLKGVPEIKRGHAAPLNIFPNHMTQISEKKGQRPWLVLEWLTILVYQFQLIVLWMRL